MKIFLFGVPCVGKSTIGDALSKKLNYLFFDIDDEINKKLNKSIDYFSENYDHDERSKIKSDIMKEISLIKDDCVIAVSPLHNIKSYKFLLSNKAIITININNTVENIFDFLGFYDEDNKVLEDSIEYKNKYKIHYMNEIKKDILYYNSIYSLVEIQYDASDKSLELIVDELTGIINNKKSLINDEKR